MITQLQSCRIAVLVLLLLVAEVRSTCRADGPDGAVHPALLSRVTLDVDDDPLVLKMCCSNDGQKVLLMLFHKLDADNKFSSAFEPRALIISPVIGSVLQNAVDEKYALRDARLSDDGSRVYLLMESTNWRKFEPVRFVTRSTSDGSLIATDVIDNREIGDIAVGGTGGGWIGSAYGATVTVFEGGRPNHKSEYNAGSSVHDFCIAGDRWLIAMREDRKCCVWDLANKREMPRFEVGSAIGRPFDASFDGKYVAFFSPHTKQVTVRRLDSDVDLRRNSQTRDTIARFVPATHLMAVCEVRSHSIHFMDVERGSDISQMNDVNVAGLTFSASGRLMVILTQNGVLELYTLWGRETADRK